MGPVGVCGQSNPVGRTIQGAVLRSKLRRMMDWKGSGFCSASKLRYLPTIRIALVTISVIVILAEGAEKNTDPQIAMAVIIARHTQCSHIPWM